MLAAYAIARRSHTPCSLKVAGESGSGYSRCFFLFGHFAPSRCAESRKIDCRRNNSLSHGFCVVSSLPLLDHRDGVFVCLGLPPAELVRRISRYALAPQLWGRSGLLPCRRPSWARGVPPSPARLGCSLRSHRPTARAALAHRCQPTAGVFIGWRSAATMAVVAIA